MMRPSPDQLIPVEQGGDVNDSDKYGWSALQFASSGGHVEVVRLLCQHGADVGASDVLGQSPLYIATFKNYSEVVNLLLDNGADIDQVGTRRGRGY